MNTQLENLVLSLIKDTYFCFLTFADYKKTMLHFYKTIFKLHINHQPNTKYEIALYLKQAQAMRN